MGCPFFLGGITRTIVFLSDILDPRENITRWLATAFLAIFIALLATSCFIFDPGSEAISEGLDIASEDISNTPDLAGGEETDVDPPTATVTGRVIRTADLVDDGVGDLWVLVVQDVQMVNQLFTAEVLGTDIIEDVDMTAEDASENYRITDVPLGTHVIIAVLDEQRSDNPYPTNDDLVSLTLPTGLIEIEVNELEEVQNLNLNASWPLF